MNCKELNIELCPYCLMARTGSYNVNNCYIIAYSKHIEYSGFMSSFQHAKKYQNNMQFFLAALKHYHPEYLDRANKLLILL